VFGFVKIDPPFVLLGLLVGHLDGEALWVHLYHDHGRDLLEEYHQNLAGHVLYRQVSSWA
jgi:hypothetical protein